MMPGRQQGEGSLLVHGAGPAPTQGHTAPPGTLTPSSRGRCSSLTVPLGTSCLPGGRGRDQLGSPTPAWERPVGWACPLSHIPGVKGVPALGFSSHPHEEEPRAGRGAEPSPWLADPGAELVGGSGGQDKEDKAGGGGLSNIRGSLGEPVALSSPAQAQDKPTSLGSTPPHSGTPGLSLSGHHGSIGPLAWTLAPVGGGRGSCLPGPGLGRASCWRTPHGHQGPGLTSQSSPFHPQPLRALASPFVAASSSQTR